MSHSRRTQTVRRLTGGALLALCVGLAIERAGAQQQGSAGANVNVISGTGADGDWTLQRQNEPSMACSSRNPQNCLAGANDYRTVDIPFPTIGEKITGDAWLGWYTTKNGGLTWRTRLLPGYPQDVSPAGIASPLKGYAAGADPVIRPGTNGLFYYGGLVFNREEGGGSAIFVARFIDNNNQEGTAGEPIAYLGASIVHRIGAAPTVVARRQGHEGRPASVVAGRRPATPTSARATRVRAGVEQPSGITQLVDKPWMAVDVPRSGAQTCSIGGPGTGVPLQTFPGGRVYMAYALFDGPDEARGRIMLSYSANCGITWSPPRSISRVQSADVNDDGVADTADLSAVQASYNRVCGQTGFNPNADVINDCKVDLLDLSFVGRAAGLPVPKQPRLSQGATLAIDPQTGTLQIAWRQFNDGVLPDAIVTVRSTNGGATVSPPTVVATIGSFDQGTTDTSFRTNAFPTMAFDAAGRAYLAWSARGYAVQRPDPAFGDSRIVLSTSTNGAAWSMPTAVDNVQEPGHQIMPALAFAQGKLQLVYYDLREDVSQLFGQYIDELPILSGAYLPRIRHTIDVRAAQADPGANPAFAAFRLSQYRSGAVPGASAIQQLEFNPPNLPIFRAGTSPFMGDYLDVATEAPFVRNGSTWSFNTAATASPVFHGIWTDNRDIRPPANGRWTDYTPPNPPFARPAMSAFDPTQPIPACVPGQAGMRNQNIYTARITRGLVVGSVGNSRTLGSIQRSFPVFAQNNGTTIRSYRLTIANQPVGGQASFKQFEQLATLDVQVPPRSTVARTVFARSTDPHAQINVNVVEISAPGGAPVPSGQQGTIVLNPDPTNPDLENPDLENPDLENPDLENSEVHNPDLENATVRNPDLENPDLENPDLENPDLENTTVANPSILNPDLENPDLENPDLENPDLENPDLENVDLVNGSLSDTTWTVTNKGNTASAYTVRLALNRQLPEGFKSQLIAHKIYQTPAALGCSLLKQSQTVLLANIPNPRFVAPGELANPDLENPDLENLTIVIAPGETARITLRVFDPIKTDAITFRAAESVTPVAVAQAVNTPEADAGVTQPSAAGVLTSSAPVPGGTSGGDYSTALSSTLPGTWTVAGGTVPPGLTVDSATGAITGTPTTPGTYTFTARFQSTTGIIDYRTVTITVGGVGADANVGIVSSAPATPVSIGTPFAFTLNVSNAGPATASNVRVTDTLPEGTTFVSATTTAGSCTHANGTVTCALGSIASGAGATIVLNVRPNVGGTHTNQAVVSANEADPIANNAAVSTASTATTPPPVTACTTVCFSGPTSFIAGPGNDQFGSLTGDFNEDGHIDLIYGPVGNNTIGLMLGNGAGGFGTPTLMTIPSSPDGGAVGDFNNDGHQDIVIVSNGAAAVWLFLGNGQGGFAAPATSTLPFAPQDVAVADFNRDGNADLAFGNSSAGALVMILLGNGNGTFQAPTTIGTTTTDSNVVVEDFNRDGNPDLAVGTDGFFAVILGNGASGFQTPVSIAVPNSQGIGKVGDLNGDGFPDLLVGIETATDTQIVLYVGNGSGGFTASTQVGDQTMADAPSVSDLDSDGDRDLVWARTGGGVIIQLNNGAGVFAAPIYLASLPASQPVVADFNGDGRPDIGVPVGGFFQSQVLVFLNVCDQPPADLELTLQPPASPVEGSNAPYTITVTNHGPSTATGVQVDFMFGTSATFASVGGSSALCTINISRVSCQLGTLSSGGVATVIVTVVPHAGNTLPTIAGVTATTSDPVPTNNVAFAQTSITPGASTLVVTNTNASGPGSLAAAIASSNDPGPRDTITFNIPGPGPHTIRPTASAQLPALTQPVVIDGTTQPGYTGSPLIEISGENAGFISGLIVSGGDSVIRGLSVVRFPRAGIFVPPGSGSGNLFEANYVGIASNGTAAANAFRGIDIQTANNTVGGTTAAARNVISGNGGEGILLNGAAATGNTVLGNYIGVNPAGTAAMPNALDGIILRAPSNTIGGTAAGAGNVISGNLSDGIDVGAGANNNVIAGNRIGTNADGTAAIGNAFQGIVISGAATGNTVGGTATAARNTISGNVQSGIAINGAAATGTTVAGNYIGTNAAGTAAIGNANGVSIAGGATNTTIGGATTAARNVISGNAQMGVRLVDAGTTSNRVLGNFIGTNATGTAAVPNGAYGVDVSNTAGGNAIGGVQAGEGNVISGNSLSGVAFRGAATDAGSNTLAGNFIGTDASGATAIGNAFQGVFVMTSNNRIGSLTPAVGNTIAFNGDNGVGVASGTGNAIVNNRIFSNGNLGIDLGNNGVTLNDTGDADAGANNLQNFPLLAAAIGGVQGTLNSTPSGTFRIEFFGNTACDSSGRGEGAILLGATSVTTDASGNATIPPFSAAAGQFVTATATDSSGNTSEFSACVALSGATAELAVTNVDSPDPIAVGGQLVYTITITNNGPNPATNVRVSTVWSGAFNVNASSGTCEFTPVFTCTLGTLASGANTTLSIVGTPGAIGSLSSTATVQADEQDPVSGNNSATATTTVTAAGPLTFVVTNTNDTGAGSLRQALLDANARIGGDTITFAIPGSGVQTIAPATALPAITDSVLLDATTQPGYAGTPLIELNGTAAGANGFNLNTSDSVIRGFTINRFAGNAITIQGQNNRIEANWLGLTAAGTAAAANGNGIIVNASGNTIGGTTASARNVVSGNTIAGLQITAQANTVAGNYIGTDPTGLVDLGNAQAGVLITGQANVIGGLTPSARNIISGNNQTGVRLALGANANLIQGNFIGTDVSGTTPLANGEGVSLGVIGASTASSNTVGGLQAGSANLIAFNNTAGVSVTAGSTNNAILGNSIIGNGGIGIDLGANGVTANDTLDADSGPNNLQNFPVLTAAVGGVQGTLNGFPGGTFRIEFFANAACDASGNGEGATFLGASAVTTDANGNATIPFFAVAGNPFVTATATDSSNNTSEFSACVQASTSSAELALTKTDSPDPATVGQPLTYTITVTNNGPAAASGVAITDDLPATVSFLSATVSGGTCSGTSTVVCNIAALPSGTTATLTIVVTPTTPGTLSNTASVTASTPDPSSGNNSGTTTTVVTGVSALSRVFAVHGGTGGVPGSVVVIDPTDNTVTNIIPVGMDSQDAALTPNGASLYVTNFSSNSVSIIDTATNLVTGTISGTAFPIGIVINPAGTRAYVTGNVASAVFVIDLGTNTVVSTIPVGSSPHGIAMRPDGTRLYVANQSSNTVSVIDTGTNTVITSIAVGTFPRHVAIAPSGTRAYVSNYNDDSVSVIDLSTNTVIATVPVGSRPFGIGVTADGTQVYVSNLLSDTVSRISTATNTVVGSIPFAGRPYQIETASNGRAYVGASNASAVRVIDTATNTIVANISTTQLPTDITSGFVPATSAIANVSLTLNDNPDPVAVGGTITYTIEVTNAGPSAATNVTVTDVLAAGTTFLSSTGAQSCSTVDSIVTCALGTIPTGQTITLQLTVRADTVGTKSNTALLNATERDQQIGNNSATAATTVANPLAELALTTTDSPDPVVVGTPLTYTVTVINNGPISATNVNISGIWNAPFSLVSLTPSQGACFGASPLQCSLGTLANGAAATVTLVVTPTAIGQLGGTVTAQADENDPLPGNNAVVVDTTVIGGPSSFVVTNTNNTGAGSLRQAIVNANASAGADVISFAIPAPGVQTITLASTLPTITGPVTIDGTTQPGFAGAPLIELNGNGLNGNGLTVTAGLSTIRGLIINRFGQAGISLDTNDGTVVEGNYIGTDATGNAAAGNGDGVVILSSGNTIGGTSAAARNLLSGNTISGVRTASSSASRNVILGNLIGTNAAGTSAIGNGQAGVVIIGSSNLVGGITPETRNVISGNIDTGVRIAGGGVGNSIQGNLIGTDISGTSAIPNREGIHVGFTAQSFGSGSTIGGLTAGAANVVAFNSSTGIAIQFGANNTILSNSIHDNGGLGIDLGSTGVTPNDPGDADSGANNLQNFPVLTAASGGVQGTLNSAPNGTFRIEFFGNAGCDASGNGEGAAFLGITTVTTDGAGNATIPLIAASNGQLVTATATDSSNNTSEFSACVQAGAQPSLTGVSPNSAAQGATLDVTLTGANTSFASGVTTVSFGAGTGIAVNSITVNSATSVTANITISPTAFTGGRTLTVTTAAEVVTNAFAVTSSAAALTALTPNGGQQGQSNLNIAVTGQGTHFAQNVTTASFGSGITVNTVTVTSATLATVNVTLQDFAAPGLRTVTLTTDGENASLVNGFNVIAGTPRLTSVTPGSGQQGQTLTFTVTGQFTSFVDGTTTASVGPGVTVNSVTVSSATTASVNVTVGVLADVGTRTVTLTTGTQSASSLDTGSFFSVTRGPAAIAQVNPASGRQAESLSVTVTGTATHFASGSTSFAFGSGITVTSAQFNSPTSATLNISISAAAALGARTVTATTLGEVAELQNAFTVSAGVAAVATVSPSTGRQAERLNVNVVGQFTHFAAGATNASFGPGVTVNSVDVTSATQVTVDVTVSPGATSGSRTVVMSTGTEVAQLVGGFTVTPGLPTLFSIAPVSSMQGISLTVILNGAFTNFTPQVTTAFFGSDISVGTVTVNGPTLASVPITIAPGASVGPRSVTVVTGSEVVSLINGFTVLPGIPAIASIDPNAGQRGLTRNITLTGVSTNWQSAITSATYGPGITVNSNVVNSPTSLTTNITIDSGAALGLRDVVVTTGTEVLTISGGFAVTDVDGTVPTLLRVSPATGAIGVPLNPVITVEFDEPLDRSTVTTTTFQLYDLVTSGPIGSTVSLDATGRVATLVPSQLLAVNRQYNVFLSNTITDVAGNHLGNQFSSFVTGFATDTTGPTLRLANPQNGDTVVARNVKVVLQFDRAINTATLGIGVRLQTGGVAVPGTFVQEDGQKRVRFTPANPLTADTTYVVTLTSDLRDVAGNALTNPGSISFTTGPDSDTTAPLVTAFNPTYNEIGVGRRPVIRVNFSERIDPISLTTTSFYLYNYYSTAVVRSTISVAPDRLSATLVPDTPLEAQSYYYYIVSPFTDIAGNTGSIGSIFFQTGGVEDTQPPTLVSIAPANGATGVPVNAGIRVTVSEPIDATSVTATTLQLTPPVPGSIVLDADRRGFLFTPSTNLAVSTTYTVQVGLLRDSSGNTMATVVSSFATSASPEVDTTGPTVVSFSPVHGSTNVSVTSPIVMTVSEPIRATDLALSMRVFVSHPQYGFIQPPGTYSVDASGTVITFTPQVPYPGAMQVFVYSNYDLTTTDLAGNVLQYTVAGFTTVEVADTTPPTVVMVTPPDGATGIGPAAVVTLTFSEPLLPSTVNNDTFTLFAGTTEISPYITRSADNTTVFLTATLPFNSFITVIATGDVTDLSGNALADFSSSFSTGSTLETNRPQIVTQRPTGPGIPADADITLFASKPLNESTVAGAVYVSQNGVLIEGTLAVSGGGTAIHFHPATTLASGATVEVFVTGDAQDLFGNALFAYSGSFTVAPDTTGQAPTIVRSTPAFSSIGNPTNAVIDVEFSEPLLPSSVTSANFYVMDASNLPVAGTLSMRNGDRTIRFTAAGPFAANNYNYVYPTNGLRDLQNVPFAGTSFYFYTGTASDVTPPVLTSVAPTNGSTGVGLNATVRLYLSEPVNPLTATSATLSLASIAGPIPAGVTYNSTNTILTLVPQVPLPGSTTITVGINGLQDLAGNSIATQSAQFTTGAGADNVRPSVIATNVTEYVTNVPVNSTFQLTFDEPMDAASVLSQATTFLYDYGLANYRPGTASMSGDGLTLTFVPDSPLAVNRPYALVLFTGLDLSGNSQNPFSIAFTTALASDTTPPVVVAVNPVAGSINVPRNARVEIRFSESISATSVGNVRLLLNSTPVSVTRVLSDTNRVLTLRPSSLLTSNRSYTISVSGVRDTTGNVMAPFTSTFTTGSKTDLIAPTVTAVNPIYGDTGVGLNVVARVSFSEPIDPLSIGTDTFRMANAAGGDYLDASVVLAPDRRSATLTPTVSLRPYMQYYFALSGYTDTAGNVGTGAAAYFYTGATLDAIAPTVVALSPATGSVGLPVNTRVTAVMSEAIDATSVSNASIQLTPSVPGTVTLSSDRVTLTFVPSVDLSTSTTYSVLITGLRDAAANTMAAAAFAFTTSASSIRDTIAPSVVSRSPSDSAAGVPVTSSVTFTTSERITAATVGPASSPVFAVISGVGTIQLAGTYSVDGTGTVITFTVAGAFPANATIQWYTNSNGSIQDMVGLALPNQVAQFTTANTADVSGPTVQAVTPTNGATDVGPYATVTLTFSESVNPNTVNIDTVTLFAGPTRLSSTLTRSLDNRMVFLTATLPPNSTITVVGTSGITDLSGNALAAFASTFTTSRLVDTNRASVITQRPTGSGVSPTTPITLFLNQPLNPSTVPGALFVSQNGVLVTGTVSVDAANQAIVFLPTTPFAESASVDVALTTAARDLDGYQVNPYQGSFTIASDPSAGAPALRRTNPAQYSIGNPTTTLIDLEFSEPVNPATVTAESVYVRDATDTAVAGTLSMRNGNRVIRFTPSAPAAANSYNYVYFTNQLLDLQGASVVGGAFYFFTAGAGDTTSPSLTIVPSAGTSGVGVNGSIRVSFSEAVNPIAVTPETVTVSAGGTPLGTTMSIGPDNLTLTVTPQRPLPGGTLITVGVNGIDDPSGNVVPVTSSSFTTGSAPDITPPTAVGMSVENGDPSVPVNSIFEWIYSEPVDATTVLGQQNILYDYGAGAYITGGTLSLSADLRRVTFVPPANLVAGRQHFVGLQNVADLAGNFGGALSAIFTTSAVSDTVAPQVVVSTPANGSTAVPLNARVRIAFDEAVNAASLEGINLLVSGLPLPVTARALSDGNHVVTLTLASLMTPNTVHSLSLAGVTDRAGNTMPAQAASTFTTGTGVDLVVPSATVVTSPVDGATNVPVGSTPTVMFSEAIDATSVLYNSTSGILLRLAATGEVVPVGYTFSTDRRTVTLTPVSPLAAGTQYYVTTSAAVVDVAGNAFPTTVSFAFTTAQ